MIPLDRLIPFPADRTRASPNHGSRGGMPIRFIVLHATGGSDAGAEEWMCSTVSRVSAHLHIRRDGSTTRLVSDSRRAWHAGVAAWDGVTDINTVSLGWEIGNANDGHEPYTDAQYWTVARLLLFYLPQGIERRDVLSHALIAPGRKTDPKAWDWSRMWRAMETLSAPVVDDDVTFEPIPVITPEVVTIPKPPKEPPHLTPVAPSWWRRIIARFRA